MPSDGTIPGIEGRFELRDPIPPVGANGIIADEIRELRRANHQYGEYMLFTMDLISAEAFRGEGEGRGRYIGSTNV